MLQITAPGSFSAKFNNPPPIEQPSKGEREYLHPSEVQALMKAAKSVGRNKVRDAAMILLMFRHGLRTAELYQFAKVTREIKLFESNPIQLKK